MKDSKKLVISAEFSTMGARYPDQEKILALIASWSFYRKPTAKRGNISIEKLLYITKNRL